MINTIRSKKRFQQCVLSLLLPAFALMPGVTQANPSGGVVVHGDVGFEGLGSSNLIITQGTDKAIINWQDFSIGKGELTQFKQPGAGSLVLNRVVSGNPSAIFGTLKANGGVMVINTNGILMGAGGVIDVAGALTLSTLDIDDNDFLNGGDNRFRGNGSAGVTNYGTISAGGDVVLLGNFIDNRGSIGSVDGTIALGAGGDIVVHQSGDAKISVKAAGRGGQVGINNEGTIEGAAVELKAHGNVYALAINNSGMIRANGANYTGGVLTLDAGPGGVITNTGTLRARNADGSGGTININAGRTGTVNLEGGEVDANGDGNRAGGVIDVQGAYINIDGGARVTADGGDGGTIMIGNDSFTRSVNIGAGATVSAVGSSGDGGSVSVTGRADSVINVRGDILANGSVNGGTISVIGGAVTQFGTSTINAGGQSGTGGAINLQGAQGVLADGTLDASSLLGDGGQVTVGTLAGGATVGGNVDASSLLGKGGNVDVVSHEMVTLAASSNVDVSGFTGGGKIRAGGGFQGGEADIANSQATTVEVGARLSADSAGGNAGQVIIWSDGDTLYQGDISARATGAVGRGGLVEVSGKNDLKMWGMVDASAVSGQSGTVLLDPGTVNVGGAGTTLPIAGLNAILDTNTNVTIATESGDVIFDALNGDFRDVSVQWNTDASLGVFASGDVRFNNHARTAGAGSVNVLAGWTGAEADAQILANDPEAAWQFYTAAGSFGDGGDVFLNANARSVEVGSRYGATNVAGDNVFVIAGNGGRQHAHLGFRDNGQVFYFHTNSYAGLSAAGDPLVGMVGVYETTGTGLPSAAGGTEWGVNMFDSTGERTDAFLMYADDFGSDDNEGDDGNWWWRTLDGRAGGSSGIGDNLPEMGAGVSQSLIDSGANHGLALGKADINVEARGALIVSAGVTGDDESDYAQVGHGGNARGWDNVNRNETNTASSQFGRSYSLNWGDNGRYSTSIGRLADVYGDINIRTGLDASLNPTLAAGAVVVKAGVDSNLGRRNNNYAQIGHMGTSQAGSAEGEINVLAGGAIGVEGGMGWRGHAQIGHAANGGNNEADPNMGIGTLASTGQTPDGKFGGGQHKQFRLFGFANGNGTDFNNGALREGTLAGHTIESITTGVNYTGAASLYDGTTAVTGEGDNVTSAYKGDIAVISATGAVSVKVFDAESLGAPERLDYSYAQIGHAGATNGMQRVSSSGDITVSGTEVLFRSGSDAFNASYSQLGHGGYNSDAVTDGHKGDIFVTATTGKVEFLGGQDVTYLTNQRSSAPNGGYSQLGHGGYSSTGPHSGDITVTAGTNGGLGVNFIGGNTRNAYVQLGHGGFTSKGTGSNTATAQGFVGDITVNSVGSVIFTAGSSLDDGTNNENGQIYAQLGHGGYDSDAANTNTDFFTAANWGHSGDIIVNSTAGDIAFTGGGRGGVDPDNNGRIHYTQLGHGGYAAGGNHHGSITVEATEGDINFLSGGATVDDSVDLFNYAQLGHGGAQDRGDLGKLGDVISVTAGGGILFDSDANATGMNYNFVHLGNGGRNFHSNSTTGAHIAEIIVNAGTGGIDFNAGPGTYSFAQIGNGGAQVQGNHLGDITVNSGGNVTFNGGSGPAAQAFAQIGHGGYDSDARAGGKLSGEIKVIGSGTGRVDFIAGTGTGAYNYAMVGHGGMFTGGDLEGNITVEAGTGGITMTASTDSYFAHSMIGHGGRDSYGDKTGSITVKAAGGGLSMAAGKDRVAGNAYTHTQIGHGGYRNNSTPNDYSGEIMVDIMGGNVRLEGGEDYGSYTMIGHGGHGAGATPRGTLSDNITVSSAGNLEIIGGQNNTRTWAQIGHGGFDYDTDDSGDIDINVGNDLMMERVHTGGTGDYSWSKIGHGVQTGNSTGSRSGNITVSVGDNATFVDGGSIGPLIGHVDFKNGGTAPISATAGNTYIGVSRNDPNPSGTGTLTTSAGTVFSSGDGGFLTELRLYMPTPAQDLIADGTHLNNQGYTRTPVPGTRTNVDEHIATEHTFTTGASGELTGDFTPEGPYPFHGLGLYNIYFSSDVVVPPVVPPVVGSGAAAAVAAVPLVEIPVLETILEVIPFNYLSFLFVDKFDSFDRDDAGLFSGLTGEEGGLYPAVGLFEANAEETEGSGPFFLEGLLDEALGDGKGSYADSEKDEQSQRRSERLKRSIGGADVVFYVFDPDTNEYSSFKVFGATRGGIQRAQ